MIKAHPTAGTPLFLITGFLGSGKTTLLSRLLREPALADTAVIVNEFGEVGLDHLLLAEAQEENVLLLDSGCLCCELQNSLAETLNTLFYRRARGEIRQFSRVVVETSGLADPGPVVAGLMADRHLAARFPLAAIVATVDAVSGVAQIGRHGEIARQVAVADRIVVTKTDLTRGEVPTDVEAKLREINPAAPVLAGGGHLPPPDQLLSPTPGGAPRPAAEVPTASNVHEPAIGSCFLPLPEPIGWEQYGLLVLALRGLGQRLLRTKGVIAVEGEPMRQVVQGVGSVFAPLYGLATPSETLLGLVLIGDGIKSDDIKSALEGLDLAAPAPQSFSPAPSDG